MYNSAHCKHTQTHTNTHTHTHTHTLYIKHSIKCINLNLRIATPLPVRSTNYCLLPCVANVFFLSAIHRIIVQFVDCFNGKVKDNNYLFLF